MPAIVLHWVVALLIFANVALAWIWPLAGEGRVRPLIDTHKSIGITLLGLVLLRILWRIGHRPPALPDHHRGWEKRTAHVVHALLYVVIVTMPLSGWIMDSAYKDAATHPNHYFGLFEWPRIGWIMALDPVHKAAAHHLGGQIHELVAKLLYVLVALHIAGALKHQLLDRDGTIGRIWPGRRDAPALR